MSKPPEEPTPFLARWSQRKRKVEAEAETVPETVEPPAEDSQAEEAENRAAAEAVDLETLDYESDYEVFLKPGVPADLRGAALQRLWRSNPVLANLDGMNEYDEDFRTPAGAAAAVVKTAWKVGKGFVDDEEAPEEPQHVAEAEAGDAPPESSVSKALPEAEPDQPQVDAEKLVEEDTAEQHAVEPEATPVVAEQPRAGIRARLDLEAFRARDKQS